MNALTVVIPAYNEGRRILPVLSAVLQLPEPVPVIIVDDGSQDNTAQVVQALLPQHPNLRLLQLRQNQGKGQAVNAAIQEVSTPFVLLLDADLRGLTPAHLTDLCDPVLTGTCDMTLGLFRGGKLATDLSHFLTPWLSGQRCLRREMFELLSQELSSGYGLETALTLVGRAQGWRVRRVLLQGVSHPPSELHRGALRGVRNRGKMYRQIMHTWLVYTRQRVRHLPLRSAR